MSTAVLGADAVRSRHSPNLAYPMSFVTVLESQGITSPLPIQSATIADALAGRDVSAKAPTGSGKTLAFALPIAAKVSRGSARRPSTLVLAPTRELATQIAETLRPLLAVRGLKVQTFFGGAGFGGQRNALRKGVDVAVACPGRLEDLLSQGDVSLSAVEVVVVDEADRMADMGFLPAVQRLLDANSSRRQTLLFSATLDGAVDVLVRRYQRDPVRHEATNDTDDIGKVTHHFESVSQADRLDSSRTSSAAKAPRLSLCEPSTEWTASPSSSPDLASRPQRYTAGAASRIARGHLHPSGRDTFGFSWLQMSPHAASMSTPFRVLCISTCPADAKDYIHRSGRTARAGADGSVITLVLPDQQAKANLLRRDLKLDPRSSTKTAPTAGHPTQRASRSRHPSRHRTVTRTFQ